MIDPPDHSPGSSPWDTNRTNRTQSSGGKYESAPFWVPAGFSLIYDNIEDLNFERTIGWTSIVIHCNKFKWFLKY